MPLLWCKTEINLTLGQENAYFLGFKPGVKGYILFDLKTRTVFISRNAIFYESNFPYATDPPAHLHTDHPTDCDYSLLFDLPPTTAPTHYNVTLAPMHIDPNHVDQPESHNNNNDSIGSSDQPEDSGLRRPDRIRKQPAYLKECHCHSAISDDSDSVKFPLSKVLSYGNISPSHMHFISTITVHEDPKTYKQAVQHQHWIDAMNSELTLSPTMLLGQSQTSHKVRSPSVVNGFIRSSIKLMDP